MGDHQRLQWYKKITRRQLLREIERLRDIHQHSMTKIMVLEIENRELREQLNKSK